MKRKTMLSLLLLFAAFSMTAQNSSQGKEFFISFMQNGYQYYEGDNPWVENTVMVSAKRACTGTITRTCGLSGSIDFSVDDNGITFVDIPKSWAYNEDNEEIIDHKAVILTASDTVSVFISNMATYSFDASFVLPTESLGSEYIIQSDQQSISDNASHCTKETSAFLIIAVEDDTEVEIRPAVRTMTGHGAGVAYTISMSAGETYSVRSNNSSEEWRDLSGSTVFARNGKKIAVFNGNTTTRIPSNAINGRDHIFEQALPIDSWGRRFAITSSEGRKRDIVKITSSADDNFIFRDGEEIAIIGYGDSYEFDLLGEDGSCFIETSEPSIVYLYHTSWQDPYGGSLSRQGDPSMVWIPPVEQRINEVTFCTFDNEHDFAYIANHYINVVVNRMDAHKLYLDGELINGSEFQPVIGSDDFCFIRKEIAHGTHHLSCESGLIAHVYGFGEARGYAYCVGANVLTLNGKMYVDGLWSGSYRNGLYTCNSDSVTMRVVTNYAVEHVDWNFGDGLTAEGLETAHLYPHEGDYLAEAYVLGYNTLTLEPFNDTMSIAIHVGEPIFIDETYEGCDSLVILGQVFDHSIHTEFVGTSIFGCDSACFLTVNISGSSPKFEIVGSHWPIGGSEIYASENEYAIQLDNPYTEIDTVIWRVDNPHWKLESHGKGETCTLSIYTYQLEPVLLHATAINECDSIHETFSIQTSYYAVSENDGSFGFEVFPNPTKGQLTLRFDDLNGNVEILVYNTLGQKVDALSLNAKICKEMIYNLPSLCNGLYYFVLRSEGFSTVRKVILER